MAIKAKFAEGATSVKTKSLYQWDYGQKLEIESADLPLAFEVHFACSGMTEAAVVPCSSVDGVGTVTIPDRCLEQTSQITAWVYEIEGTSGSTTKVITIPVVSRTRPSTGEEVPASAVDKYTELIAQVNAALEALKNGSVTAAKAVSAANADYATSAGNAASATSAATAQMAEKARVAENAEFAGFAKYLLHFDGGTRFEGQTEIPIEVPGTYMFAINVDSSSKVHSGLIYICDLGDNVRSTLSYVDYDMLTKKLKCSGGSFKNFCQIGMDFL